MCLNTSLTEVPYQLPDAARYLAAAVAIFSALCSLAIIATHVCLRCLPNRSGSESHSRLFVIYLSVCDLAVCVMNAIGALTYKETEIQKDIALCQAQAVIGIYFNLAFTLWVVSFVIFLYISIVKDNIKHALSKLYLFHLISWGLPVIVALLSWFLRAVPESVDIVRAQAGTPNHFSRATVGWCWIGEYPQYPTTITCDNARLMWMMLAGRGWELAAYLIMPVFVVYIHRYVNSFTSPLSYRYSNPATMVIKHSMRSISNRTYMLVASFILLRLWGSIRVFFDYGSFFQSNQQVNEIFTYFQAIGDNAQGVMNIILFIFLSPKITNDFNLLCRSRCPCCCMACSRRERQQEQEAEAEERRRFHDQQANYRDTNYASPAMTHTGEVVPHTWGYDPNRPASLSSTPSGFFTTWRFKRNRSASNRSMSSNLVPDMSRNSRNSMEMTVSSRGSFMQGMDSQLSTYSTTPLSLDLSRPGSSTSSPNSRYSGMSGCAVIPTPVMEHATEMFEANRETPSSPQPLSYTTSVPLPSGGSTERSMDGATEGPRNGPPAVPPHQQKLPTSPPVATQASVVRCPPPSASNAKTPLLSDTDEMHV